MTIRVHAAGQTHVGLVRRRNEDQLYVGSNLLAVADGLGGHVAGDVASRVVIEVVKQCDHRSDPASLADVLGRVINRANDALRAEVEGDPAVAGMGTTLVAMLYSEATAVLANIGDSRAYLMRTSVEPGTLMQITEDHTYGHLVADAGDVPQLPDRLARYLDGRLDGRSPDLTAWTLRAGDRFLLCSDGLSSYVPHREIESALTADAEPEETTERLISLALDHGGHDNVTVIVANCHG